MARLETTMGIIVASESTALALLGITAGADTTTIIAMVVSAGSTSRDLIHVGVAHGRGLHGRNRSLFVLLYFPRKCHAGHVAAITATTNPDFPM